VAGQNADPVHLLWLRARSKITIELSRFPWLFVIARNSSFTYKGRAVDVKQVARELGVRYARLRRRVAGLFAGELLCTTSPSFL
jgi:hypothetical protein